MTRIAPVLFLALAASPLRAAEPASRRPTANGKGLPLRVAAVHRWPRSSQVTSFRSCHVSTCYCGLALVHASVPHLRSVRTPEFKYIRNYLNERPHLQPNRYKDDKAIVKKLRELHVAGKLDELQEKLLFAEKRPPEELYDLTADPHEVNNLAADPKHKAVLEAMRKKLADWEEATGDKGRKPEPMAMYDSDMKVYLGGTGNDKNEILRQNIEPIPAGTILAIDLGKYKSVVCVYRSTDELGFPRLCHQPGRDLADPADVFGAAPEWLTGRQHPCRNHQPQTCRRSADRTPRVSS